MEEKEFEYKEEYAHCAHACLNLTDDCNLACTYCFVNQNPNYMSLEVAKKSVDFLANNLLFRRSLYNNNTIKGNITFFGGEPLIMFDSVIVPLINYIETNYIGYFNFDITTNGTLLNEEKLKFLKEHKIYPLISMDGAENTQTTNRPCKNTNLSSFKILKNNLPKIFQYFPNIECRATINQKTVKNLFEDYCFIQEIGFKKLFIIPNCREDWSEENIEILKTELAKIFLFRLNEFRLGFLPGLDMSNFNNQFLKIVNYEQKIIKHQEINQDTSHSITRCGLGTRNIAIGYDGKIYGCQEQVSLGEDSKFFIGNIFQGIDQEKHKKFLYEYSLPFKITCSDPKECDNCPLVCNSDICPSMTFDLYDSFFIDSKIHCVWLKELFKNSSFLMKILIKNKNEAFKEYLITKCDFPVELQEVFYGVKL